jgi:hypothetical protein
MPLPGHALTLSYGAVRLTQFPGSCGHTSRAVPLFRAHREDADGGQPVVERVETRSPIDARQEGAVTVLITFTATASPSQSSNRR